jgi:hypothetical protein
VRVPRWRETSEEPKVTRFLLLVNYDNGEIEEPIPMLEWDPADVKAHMAYYEAVNRDLEKSGELVGGEALAWPEQAKVVRADGSAAPVVTDGPYAEAKEILAGYTMVDVESLDRAIEIAARLSAVPGPGGVPIQQPIEVRQIVEDGAELGLDLS